MQISGRCRRTPTTPTAIKKREAGPTTSGPPNVWGDTASPQDSSSLNRSGNQPRIEEPRRATTGSAGVDICATTRLVLTPKMGVQIVESDFKGPLQKETVGLLLGRSSTTKAGLIVHPGVIDPHYEGVVKITVSSPRGITAINHGDHIAQILMLPSKHDQYSHKNIKRGQSGFGLSGTPLTCLTLELGNRPMHDIKIRDRNFSGLLDTGADHSIIKEDEWPKDWPLNRAEQTLRGLGIAQAPLCSAATLPWKDLEGHEGVIQPYVLKIPVSLWGRDILTQMNLKLTTETFYSEQSNSIMRKQGYTGTGGLGKNLTGRETPIPLSGVTPNKFGGPGLGFSSGPLRKDNK